MWARRAQEASRRGSVALIVAAALVAMLGIGAMAIDVAYMRLAQAQAQDVADAASVAGLWAMRQTGDLNQAVLAAEAVVKRNAVAGEPASLSAIEFGDWDSDQQELSPDFDTPNGVRVRVERAGANEVPLFLGKLFGYDSVSISGEATAASRNIQIILVMDITNSWSPANFTNARNAAVAFYDVVAQTHGPFDQIGMNVFTGRYAWAFTPLTLVEDAEASGGIRKQWVAMRTASKAGTAPDGKTCTVYTGGKTDKFNNPARGCFPNMPREYSDEPGTDHTTGLQLARQMFEADPDETAYRGIVVVTDGQPNGTLAGHGDIRKKDGYKEQRWDEYLGPAPHGVTQIKNESVLLAEEMWEEDEIHTWVVSIVTDDRFMRDMAQGDGYYSNTTNSLALVRILEEIAYSFPLAVVE